MKRKAAITISILLLISILALTGAMLMPAGGRPEQTAYFEIKKGASLNRIAANLESRGLIASRFLFKWGSIFLGKRKSIKSGEYEIKGQVSTFALIQLLSKGTTVLKKVTIPEGRRMTEIFQILSKSGFGRYEEYIKYSVQPTFLNTLGLGDKIFSLEGFLYPETYFFSKNVSAKTVLRTMVKAFFENTPEDYGKQARMVGLSYYKAVILASIIEKETSASSERQLIASVFHNRLKQNMKLQTDPTVIYGIKNFNGNLTRKQLRTPTPYNTYMVKGLPPTPIASPGMAALMAAVRPAVTDYLFFVAKGDGTHKFTSNYRDHRRAVVKYQKRRRRDYKSF